MLPFEALLPPRRQVATGAGPQPIPYVVENGHGVLITGTGDAARVAALMSAEDVHPVGAGPDRAALGVFLCRFEKASSGPHLEVHIGALAAPERGADVGPAPEAFLAAFATRRDWGVLSLGLWNDDAGVVALNSAYFGLDARAMTGEISVGRDHVAFDLRDDDGHPLATGRVGRRRHPEPGPMWRLFRLMGWRAFWAAGRAPWAVAHVINRKSEVMGANRRAVTLSSNDEMAVMRWRPGRDEIALGPGPDFRPLAMQHLSPFRFAYLHPDDPMPAP